VVTPYHGPAPLDGSRAFTAWNLDVPVLLGVALVAALYIYGVRRLADRGTSWPVHRTVVFLVAGLGSIVIATMSALGVYDRVLFWPNAVQNIVLLSVSPVLLGLGRPLELAGRCLPARPSWVARIGRVATFPMVTSLLGVVVLFTLYFTPYYAESLRHPAVHQLLRLELLVAGALFFWPMLDDDALPSWCTHPIRVLIAGIDGLVDAIPGIVVMTGHSVIAAGYYRSVARDWGPSLAWDQTIGGGLMLTIAEAVGLPFLIAIVAAWARADDRAAVELDRRLDLQRMRHDATLDDESATDRPWWEVDPGPLGDRIQPKGRRTS